MSELVSSPSTPLGTRVVRSVASGIVLTLATNVFLFIGQLAIPRALSREDYAHFTVSISFVALLALVADLGMTPMFVRLFAKAEEDVLEGKSDRRGELFGTALGLRLAMSVVVALLVVFVGGMLYPTTMVQNMAILLTTLLISSRLSIVRAVAEAVLRGKRKYHTVAMFALPDAIAFAVILIVTSHRLTLTTALWIYALCNVPGFILLAVWLGRWIKSERIHIRIDHRVARSLVREALPLIFWTAFLTIHSQIDSLLLDKLSTSFEVSSYAASVRVLTAALPIPMVLASVIAPELTRLLHRGDAERSRQLVSITLRVLLAASIAIALVLSVGSETVTVALLSTKYIAIAPLLKWMGWMLVPIFVGTLLTETSVAGGSYWFSTIYAFIIMAVVILCDLLLIPPYGALGAIMSKLIAVTTGCVVFVLLLRRSQFFALREFVAVFLRASLAAIAGAAVLLLCNQELGMQALTLAATMTTFVAVVYLTKLLTIHDLRLAFSKIRK